MAGIFEKNSKVELGFLRRRQEQRRGAQASSFAASGVSIGSGSPLRLLTTQAGVDKFTEIRQEFQDALRIRALKVQANFKRAEAKAAKQAATQAAIGGFLSANAGMAS